MRDLPNIIRREQQARAEAAIAGKVVAMWNSRLAVGRELWFSPTIKAVVTAARSRLRFYCPGCGVVGEVDLRRLDRHPNTPSDKPHFRRCPGRSSTITSTWCEAGTVVRTALGVTGSGGHKRI